MLSRSPAFQALLEFYLNRIVPAITPRRCNHAQHLSTTALPELPRAFVSRWSWKMRGIELIIVHTYSNARRTVRYIAGKEHNITASYDKSIFVRIEAWSLLSATAMHCTWFLEDCFRRNATSSKSTREYFFSTQSHLCPRACFPKDQFKTSIPPTNFCSTTVLKQLIAWTASKCESTPEPRNPGTRRH